MSCEARASAAIREHELRVTAPRLQILSLLMHAEGHLTARDVVQRVGGSVPHTPPSTVYRTLAALRDARLVSETLMADGETVYESTLSGGHHHVECRRCGGMSDVRSEMFEDLRDRLLHEQGFLADLDHLVLRGICARCVHEDDPSPQAGQRRGEG